MVVEAEILKTFQQVYKQLGWPWIGDRVSYVQPEGTLFLEENGRKHTNKSTIHRTGVVSEVTPSYHAIGSGSPAFIDYRVRDEVNGEEFGATGLRLKILER